MPCLAARFEHLRFSAITFSASSPRSRLYASKHRLRPRRDNHVCCGDFQRHAGVVIDFDFDFLSQPRTVLSPVLEETGSYPAAKAEAAASMTARDARERSSSGH